MRVCRTRKPTSTRSLRCTGRTQSSLRRRSVGIRGSWLRSTRCVPCVRELVREEWELTREGTQACREFVNRNAACTAANKSPELLAKYADGLLKKSNKASEEADLEQALADTVRPSFSPPLARTY